MASTPEIIKGRLTEQKSQNTEQTEYMQNQIAFLDTEKQLLDEVIESVDNYVIGILAGVNDSINAVSAAYEDRISTGCRTMLQWSLTGVTTGSPSTYNFTCVEVPVVGFGTNTAIVDSVGGITTYAPGASPPGVSTKELYGLKYYDEPHNKDILDALVGSFIGTVGTGSSVITVMNPAGTGALENAEIGNLIVCNVSGVFPGITTIVGFGTTVADLGPVGLGVTGSLEEVETVIVTNYAAANVTAPLELGGFGQFSVLRGGAALEVTSKPLNKSPLTPQTIGIMESGVVGLGTFVEIDTSGSPDATQSWNPFLDGVKKGGTKVQEPRVGAGLDYFKEGFTQAPAIDISGTLASVGSTISLSVSTPYYVSLPGCSGKDAVVSLKLNEMNQAEAEFADSLGDVNTKLAIANSMRYQRYRYTIQIWGIRQTLGELYNERDQLDIAIAGIGGNSLEGIID